MSRYWSSAGRACRPASQPKFVAGWQLGKPDLILTLDRPYTLPASGSDVFRIFILHVPAGARRFVSAMEVRPGNQRIVHYANVLIDRDGVGNARAMAWELDGGTDLVLNMHLQPPGKPELLQPSIGLYFTETAPVKHPVLLQLEHDGALDIPPGKSDFVITDPLRLPVDADLLAIYPHAHYIGKDIQAFATLPGGARRWLIHIPDWDIAWQAVYRYRSPVFLPKGTVISMRYTYDNSAANPRNPSQPPRRIVNGDRSVDEMAHLWLQVLPRAAGGDPRVARQRALMERRLEKYPNDFLAQYTLGGMAEAQGNHADALSFFKKALAAQPANAPANDAPALSNLGVALHMTGKVEEGIEYLRRAVASQPGYSEGRYNLGQALAAAGDLDAAAAELRAAVTLSRIKRNTVCPGRCAG